ncbi:MAG TPA: EFR1 family ferrodoxin [Smithella sp.]|nr:EFR1 family ferrodoxin [Smithella sp.]
MNAALYFYSGTGNSLWTAKKLSALLGNARLVPVAAFSSNETVTVHEEYIGLIFPVHIWGVPPPVIRFLEKLQADASVYFFAIAVNAGQVAATLLQLQHLLKKKNIKLSAGFSLGMPSNYIPWSGPPSAKKQQKLFDRATVKVNDIASWVKTRKEAPPERGPFWQNALFSMIYNKTYAKVPQMDKLFWADGKCSACGICAKICPAKNIQIREGKPLWQHRCEQCFACIQWCPEEAIQYGRLTSNKKRYHHPEINLKEMIFHP